ncbi:MAG: type VII secretion protein EssC [Eubacteriales bacterium]|nr:type VII secretion protein EssC [Eubacteriales bacterium]
MGLIIAVYTKEAFKEYVMPAINNADYSFVLNKNYFRLRRDIRLNFEVINDEWKIEPGRHYKIYREDKREIRSKTSLSDLQILRIITSDQSQIILMMRQSGDIFHSFSKYSINQVNRITIGTGPTNMIRFEYRRLISDRHAEIERRGSDYVITNMGQNGLYVNSKYIHGSEKLRFGDYINIYSLHIVFLGNILAIDTTTENLRVNEMQLPKYREPVRMSKPETENEDEQEQTSVKKLFRRAIRIIEKLETDPIEIEEPPKEMKSPKKPLLMTIGPSFTMAIPMLLGALLMIVSARMTGSNMGLFMYSGMVMAGSSAIIGVTWGIMNLRYQRKTEAETETQRYEAYSSYLLKKTEEIRKKYTDNQTILNRTYPDTGICLTYDENVPELWNRNPSHEDFLSTRVGIGDMPFQIDIAVPKERFRLERDELAEKPAFIEKNYETLKNVPILLNLLEHKIVGIVGGKGKKGAMQVAQVIASQIAASNSYTEVKMIFVYDKENSENYGQWEFARWFPHVWSEDRRIRYIASDKLSAGEVFYEVTKILRQRTEDARDRRNKEATPIPYFVLFLSDPALIEDEMIARFVYDSSPVIGLTTIMLSETAEMLPNACKYIVQNDSAFQGVYDAFAQREDRTAVKFDQVDTQRLEKFARRLANIEVQEVATGGEIPDTLTFFDMYGIGRPSELHAEERWLKNRIYESIRGQLGQKAGGVPCFMDLHEKQHGPHGLVAGTTGSGKSETLQTYMLSLAINYSPDDIGFFIIDYKGGGMANLFEGLPHMIGQISNLSGNQVYRAMVSIESENRRRQRIFAEHGVNNINDYTKLYKNREASVPLPHLMIIIDEFAELKRNEPEFMDKLISVAAIGRSLGVHLILATQKPSGTVDDKIWSNSKFHLCLRVQDRQDSNDMLHKPDAAYITQAGRGYLQVGADEVYELFQSGWSGAPYEESLDNNKVEIAKLLTVNGKTELTGGHARAERKAQVARIWIEHLISCLENTKILGEDQLKEAVRYRGTMLELIDQFYTEIEAAKLDYQRSEHNSSRLENFIRLYEAAKTDGAEDITAEIQKQSEIRKMKLPEGQERTQLEAVKDYLHKTAEEQGYQQQQQLWMPVLSDHIYLDDFEEYRKEAFENGVWKQQAGAWSLDVPIGMLDDPENQIQMPLRVSFSEGGHHAVIGSVVSGKSTMIQSILYGLTTKYNPDYVNIYALDFSSKMAAAFEGLPHVGGVMYEGDDEKIAKFFNMISRILDERKKVFRGGNYSQYVQVHGMKYPAIVIAIDNFSSFKEKTEDVYERQILQISKEGVGHGIFLLLSAGGFGMSEIPNKIAENMKTILCLELPDKFAYADVLHTTRIPVMPENGIKGRGLAVVDSRILEYQTALALEAEDDYQRMEKIREKCRELDEAWTGNRAQPVPEIPAKPTWPIFTALRDVQMLAQTDHMIPVGYDAANAEIYSVDLAKVYCYLIAGSAKSGKKNFMRVMIESAKLKKAQIAILDIASQLSIYANQEEVIYASDIDGVVSYFIEKLRPEFVRRNQWKKEIIADGGEAEELYDLTRKEQPILIFIPDIARFVSTIYHVDNISKGIGKFMENLTEKGQYHNIYFIASLSLEDKASVMGYQTFNNFVSYRTGIHFGGDTTKNSFMSFEYLPFKEQVKGEKAGIGQLSEINGEITTQKVVVPLMTKNRKKKE